MMKNVNLILVIIGLFSAIEGSAQETDIKSIEKVITAFSKAADSNDSKTLGTYLDDNFRIVSNRLFGSETVSTMDKNMYLEKIESKEYGGDKRKINIDNIVINGTTASAKVAFKGSKMTFISILVLIKDNRGNWTIASDIPVVI